MKSIRTRIILSHFIVIFLITLVVEGIMWIEIKNYYYTSIEELLREQSTISSNFYNKYLSSISLDEISDDLIENFSSSTNAEIQILNNDKKIIADSIGNTLQTQFEYSDVDEGLKGKTNKWIGRLEDTNEKAMAVSSPLKENRNIIGVVRVITSLESVDSLLNRILTILIIVGIFIIAVSTFISAIISNTIIRPLNEVTNVAREMANGNFSISAKKKYDDEVGSLADTLNYMTDEIVKNEKLKNDFISSISHELRTPLTSIKGWGLTLKLKQFKEPIKLDQGLDIIIEESDRLTSLVEELLDFSRFQSGRITLNIEEVNIDYILRSVVRQMTPRAERLGIEIKENIEELPFIKGDISRLKQVFINIIDNALKFSEEGEKVTVSAICEHNAIEISVEDTGCGIKEEDISIVKKKFYKGNSKKSGSGIGLAICDEIISMHKGSIFIESFIGKGTKIIVGLPKTTE